MVTELQVVFQLQNNLWEKLCGKKQRLPQDQLSEAGFSTFSPTALDLFNLFSTLI